MKWIARAEVATDFLTGDRDVTNLSRVGSGNQLTERDRFFVVLELGGKIPDQYPDDHEYDPEHQALQSGVQAEPPPTCVSLKISTCCAGSVTRKASSIP